MQKFVDPELFSNDLIANYFQSITPSGYAAVYQLMASLGINPLLLSKILPIVLGLITTGYCFCVCLQMLPVPVAAFTATLLLNQSIWLTDNLVSATPRAFVYPLFLAFLYYLLRRSLLSVCVAIALQGLFYPLLVFISGGILFLGLWDWQRWPPRLEQNRNHYLLCAAGLGVAFLVMLPYALTSSEFGSTVTASEARAMPDFWPGGRVAFFDDNPWKFWLIGKRSGILRAMRPPLSPPLLSIGLLLPVVLRNPSRFPLVVQVKNTVTVLPQIVLVSLGLFLAAHALLLKLFFPGRYPEYTLRVVIALAAGIALTIILDAVFRWAAQKAKAYFFWRQSLALGLTALLSVVLILYPMSWKNRFPKTSYVVGGVPALYEFFSHRPKDILIASLAEEANNLPTFSQRSILVSSEYVLPYHLGYYRQIRQRVTDLIRAQYSPNLADVQNLIRAYKVDFFLLERAAFTPEYVASNRWLKQFQPVTREALATLEKQTIPALASVTTHCSVFENESFVVLQAECIVTQKST